MSIKEKFNITGLYYETQGYKFRKYLNIKKKGSNIQDPAIMIVMMNPGGSRPLDGIDNNTTESEAIPDRTQDQIMKVMSACKLEYARVLNLSDIRESKSNKLFPKLLKMDRIGIQHSIFDKRNRNDFDSLFIKGIPVIFAWGVDKKLNDLAEKAIKIINADNPIGLLKDGSDWAYYHPLPQVYKKQIEWVESITKSLKRNRNDN